MKSLSTFFDSKFSLSTEKILFANSLKELIFFIPDVLKPKKVLIVGPALDIYEDAARAVGAEVFCITGIEMDVFAGDSSFIQKKIRGADLVFLGNPNRITGKEIPLKTVHEFIKVLSSERVHFVIDESLRDFAGSEDYWPDMLNLVNFILLRTTAFFYGIPGLELAHAVSSPEIIRLFKQKKQWDINILSVAAARAAYKDSAYISAARRFIESEKSMIMKKLLKMDWIKIYDTDTNVFLIKIDNNSDEVARQFRRSGLDISNCADIKGLDGSFFRVSVMKHENNLKFISALSRV